jgi:hypothetical protein
VNPIALTDLGLGALYAFTLLMGMYCCIRASIAFIERRRHEQRNRGLFVVLFPGPEKPRDRPARYPFLRS